MISLEVLSRLVTRPEHNVNLVFHVEPGWEARFSSFPLYFLLLAAVATLTFYALERVAVRLTRGWTPTRVAPVESTNEG